MIFGYSTNAYVKFSLIEAIERIAGLGFRGVEIMGDRPHLYPPDFEEKDLARLKGNLAIISRLVTVRGQEVQLAGSTPRKRQRK